MKKIEKFARYDRRRAPAGESGNSGTIYLILSSFAAFNLDRMSRLLSQLSTSVDSAVIRAVV